MLVRLLYASRAVGDSQAAVIHDIMQQSHAHNPHNGITGVLCFSDKVYMQVLEGGRAAINALYAKILRDSRHTDVVLLHYEEIAEREFAGWSMGHVQLSRMNRAMVLKYSETGKLDPYTMSGKALTGLFHELVSAGAIACS